MADTILKHGLNNTIMTVPKLKLGLLIVFCLILFSANAQTHPDLVVGQKHEHLKDSLKATEYPYILPILGKKAAKLGIDLPYSAGLGVNYVWQRSELIIENLSVGFNHGPLHNLDEIIRFNSAVAEGSIVNFRPDAWVLPFLNVYGIIARSNTSTAVGFGIWVPNDIGKPDGDWREIANFNTKASFSGNTTVGFGLTPTMGVGGGWIALDMNFTWSDVSALDKPVYVFNLGPRFGKTFRMKKPQQNIAIWVGGFRVKFASETSGSLPISDFISLDTLSMKVAQGQAKVTQANDNLNTWWNGLTAAEKLNPVNKAKFDAGTRVITRASEFFESADAALDRGKDATIQYSLDKRVKDAWNFIFGGQFQLNKHWMLRAEYGFLGSRKQFIGGLQYRFGL